MKKKRFLTKKRKNAKFATKNHFINKKYFI